MQSRSITCSLLILPFVVMSVAGRISIAQTSEGPVKHTMDSVELIRLNIAAKKAVLIDVRELSEWEDGHLEDAVLLPLSELKKDAQALVNANKKKLGETKIIYCHCKSGGRVLRAAPILKKLGYDCRPLKMGYDELVKAGFEDAETPSADKD